MNFASVDVEVAVAQRHDATKSLLDVFELEQHATGQRTLCSKHAYYIMRSRHQPACFLLKSERACQHITRDQRSSQEGEDVRNHGFRRISKTHELMKSVHGPTRRKDQRHVLSPARRELDCPPP